MRSVLQEAGAVQGPESVLARVGPAEGTVLLRSHSFDPVQSRYSLIAANPFLVFRSFGSLCRVRAAAAETEHFGNPWRLLDRLMARYELLEEIDLPFPLGGCFGYWGYDLKNFVEPKISRRAVNDLGVPDCWVGFYGSLVVIDHWLGKTWILATGLTPTGTRDARTLEGEIEYWRRMLASEPPSAPRFYPQRAAPVHGNVSREQFIGMVERARDYIHRGHIYQVNLSHRLETRWPFSGWELFTRLSEVSPAPCAAYLNCGDFEICSSSPELFLRLSASHIKTRPIKGTRPRHPDPNRDAQLSLELQTSPKEMSELVMITDLLRNDLGRVCEYGSIHVPDLARLEKFAHVQHLVSTVEGRLRREVTHFEALRACFPGGSITGAPKVRAMEIIDEFEPLSRGPYTGALGYLGFNRESQLSVLIRAALVKDSRAYFNVGAGIVADSVPEMEFEETLAKARGFLEAVGGTVQSPAPVASSSSSGTWVSAQAG